MSNEELIKVFYEIVTSNGKNISKRHKKSYWVKNGFEDIYDLIIERTSFLDTSIVKDIKHRIIALENNFTEHPRCITCGKPVMIVERRRYSKFCSKECFFKDPNFKNNKKEASKLVDHKSANEKRSATMIEKYGVPYNSQRSNVKEILSKSKIKESNSYGYSKLMSYDWMYENYITRERTLVDIAKELNVFYGTVGDYCLMHGFEIRQRSNYSLQEIEVGEFVNSIGFDYTSDRKILNGNEIDIFISEKNFGIEVNGLYWHSYNRFETADEKNRHIDKTLMALNKDVQLIHIFDYEWINKMNIVKSIISNKLNKTANRIYARNCVVKEVDSKTSSKFLEDNHIQSSVGAKIKLGLFYDENLVMLMTFGLPRFNKKYSWEVIRLCTIIDTNVVGGASKLFKHFLNNYYNGGGIICYADRRFGEGGVYNSLGMEYQKSTPPSYKWTDGTCLWSRNKFQKHKLKDILKIYDDNLSEAENMFNNRMRRIWDCGSNIFVYK